jgi:thiol-disulfide isomerase/thioredoxin
MKRPLKMVRRIFCLGAIVLAACGQSGNSVTADWHASGNEAKQIALQTHRPLFVAFMGSDWSEPCQTMRKEILDTPAFKNFADDKLVLVMADFPRGAPLAPEQARENAEMAKGAQLDRLPVFLLVDPRNGVAFSRIANFSGTPESFVAQLQAALEQYQLTPQSSAQASNTPLPSNVPSFSQPAPVQTNAPTLPALPAGSLPSPEELMRRQQQAPPSPQ